MHSGQVRTGLQDSWIQTNRELLSKVRLCRSGGTTSPFGCLRPYGHEQRMRDDRQELPQATWGALNYKFCPCPAIEGWVCPKVLVIPFDFSLVKLHGELCSDHGSTCPQRITGPRRPPGGQRNNI